MSRDIGEKVSKNLSVKYGQKSLDHTKQSATDALKTISRRKITKTAEATGDFFGNKIADRITKVSTTSPHNNYETITNKCDKEKTNEKYISPKEKQYVINDLRLIQQYNNGISKSTINNQPQINH